MLSILDISFIELYGSSRRQKHTYIGLLYILTKGLTQPYSGPRNWVHEMFYCNFYKCCLYLQRNCVNMHAQLLLVAYKKYLQFNMRHQQGVVEQAVQLCNTGVSFKSGTKLKVSAQHAHKWKRRTVCFANQAYIQTYSAILALRK